MNQAEAETSLTVRQIIRVPREKVFDAFVIPEVRKQWWSAGPGNRCTLCEIDGRAGGAYRINMLSQGTEHIMSGSFREFSRPEKLVFTWTSGDAVDSVVTVLFRAIDAKTTEVSLTHERLPNVVSRDEHARGWAGCMESLRLLQEEGIGDAQKHFQLIVRAEAPVEKVYRALTTAEGLRGWWTNSCDVGTKVGEALTFRFGASWKKFQIEKLEPNREVRWRCIDQYLDNMKKANEWVGTSVLFQLSEHPKGGTRILLQHLGFTPQFECYQICEEGWHHFAGRSLKKYVETGTGQPFIAETMQSCKDVERSAV